MPIIQSRFLFLRALGTENVKKKREILSIKNVVSMETHVFWMPDYFPAFSCKMGSCRNTCCKGWPISFSLEDYFRLINQECSPSLREKLDRGVKTALKPTPGKYAEIAPCYDGTCPLRLGDGRCSIHAELGEQALPNICRLYPRGIRKEEDGYEISCTNSCEAVLELFLFRRESLGFLKKEWNIKLPPIKDRIICFKTYGQEREIRLSLIKTMQNRCFTLPERLAALRERLLTLESAMKAGKVTSVQNWLYAEEQDRPVLPKVTPKHLAEGLQTAEKLIGFVDERSVSVRAYGEEALACFGSGEGAFERYKAAEKRFHALFPDWEIFFEHMLVNHMFFTCFPFEDRPEDLRTEFMALCSVYTLLRFFAIGCAEHCGCREDFIDVFAAAFRLIDHTAFDIYVSHFLHDLGWTSDEKLLEWIIL